MTDQPTGARREIRGYDAVRAAARDYQTYSSDLRGELDVRSYRQLPLEADPPRHTLFRNALQPIFMSSAIEPKVPKFENLALELIERITARGGGEITSELALPFVIGCLTIIYDRPQDFDEWCSWGPEVWLAEAYDSGVLDPSAETRRASRDRRVTMVSQRSGAMLENYLTRVFNDAGAKTVTHPEKMDVWDKIYQITIDGAVISREEMHGIGSLLLAGGRDTVIKLITGLTWHLLQSPEDREYLTQNAGAFSRTISEMVRFLTPLQKMERVLPEDRTPDDADRDPSKYVLLNFASANFDKKVWPDAETVDIHRERKPHLAFGFGRHSCLGMNVTEHEAKAFLRVILSNWPNWTLAEAPEIEWVVDGEGEDAVTLLGRFVSLRVKTTA